MSNKKQPRTLEASLSAKGYDHTEAVKYVRNNLDLSDRELSEETGLTKYEVSVIREVEETPGMQSNQSGKNQGTREIESSPDKFSIHEISITLGVSKSKFNRDLRKLDFIEKKKLGGTIYINSEELNDYKEYLEESGFEKQE